MRIGLHTGEMIGGVVGTGIIRFDLYGQDVVITNKMESEGIPDKVKVSLATKNMLDKYSENYGDIGYTFEKQDIVKITKLGIDVENFIVEKNEELDPL